MNHLRIERFDDGTLLIASNKNPMRVLILLTDEQKELTDFLEREKLKLMLDIAEENHG